MVKGGFNMQLYKLCFFAIVVGSLIGGLIVSGIIIGLYLLLH